MAHDYLMRQLETMSRALALQIFQREELSVLDLFDTTQQQRDEELLWNALEQLLAQGKINEAENLLFERLDENPADILSLYSLGLAFYRRLLALSEEELAAGNFTAGEVREGVEEMERRLARLL